eukprot:1351337-Alexandrium_andersonii.AAC.1
MPRDSASVDLPDDFVEDLMTQAQALVAREFDPAEHLPGKVFDFIKPICVGTCQGYYAVAMMMMMMMGAMPAITNGAAVPLWNQKGTPLTSVVIHVGNPQGGKSRLTPVVEEIFDICDDVLEEIAAKE